MGWEAQPYRSYTTVLKSNLSLTLFTKRMNKLLPLLLIAVLVSGCSTVKPPDDIDFGSVHSINDLAGNYQNLGEKTSQKSRFRTYLSRIIWPNDESINHETIVSVEVKVIDSHTLYVTAHTKDGVAKEDTFVAGKNFELRSGRIYLKQKIAMPGAQVPVAGVYYESVVLGLDKKGHGKYQENFAITGLAFMLIPIAYGESENVRFVRIK